MDDLRSRYTSVTAVLGGLGTFGGGITFATLLTTKSVDPLIGKLLAFSSVQFLAAAVSSVPVYVAVYHIDNRGAPSSRIASDLERTTLARAKQGADQRQTNDNLQQDKSAHEVPSAEANTNQPEESNQAHNVTLGSAVQRENHQSPTLTPSETVQDDKLRFIRIQIYIISSLLLSAIVCMLAIFLHLGYRNAFGFGITVIATNVAWSLMAWCSSWSDMRAKFSTQRQNITSFFSQNIESRRGLSSNIKRLFVTQIVLFICVIAIGLTLAFTESNKLQHIETTKVV